MEYFSENYKGELIAKKIDALVKRFKIPDKYLKPYTLRGKLQRQLFSEIPVVVDVADQILTRFEDSFPLCGARVIEYAIVYFLDPRYNIGNYDMIKDATVQSVLQLRDLDIT